MPEVVEATRPDLRALLLGAIRGQVRLEEKVDGLITHVGQLATDVTQLGTRVNQIAQAQEALGTRVNQLVQAQGAMDTRMADLHRALPLPKMYHVRARARQP